VKLLEEFGRFRLLKLNHTSENGGIVAYQVSVDAITIEYYRMRMCLAGYLSGIVDDDHIGLYI
jgi:hypothetical protein